MVGLWDARRTSWHATMKPYEAAADFLLLRMMRAPKLRAKREGSTVVYRFSKVVIISTYY